MPLLPWKTPLTSTLGLDCLSRRPFLSPPRSRVEQPLVAALHLLPPSLTWHNVLLVQPCRRSEMLYQYLQVPILPSNNCPFHPSFPLPQLWMSILFPRHIQTFCNTEVSTNRK